MIKLIAFLGNPGAQYAENRHNAGSLFAKQLLPSTLWQKKYKGLYAVQIPNKIHCLIPQTYMNLSGESVQEAASFYKIKPEEILVVHDELDLALGQASFKFGGGLGGHNGLRSIKACLNSADFWRLRIGIGRPGGKKNIDDDISAWVLSDFTKDEAARLERVFAACTEAFAQALLQGPESLLPEWSKKDIQQVNTKQ